MRSLTPISTLWFWRGLTGHSVTFAALFGSLLLGFSISKGVHHLLSALGFHWLYVLLLPILLFRMMAKAETRWITDEKRRRTIALAILLGSIVLSSAIGWLRAKNPHGTAGADSSRPIRSQGVERG